MKRLSKESRKIGKDTSSAVLMSILIHAGFFLLAGMLVVFTVVKREKEPFESPMTVKRQRIELKRLKVNLKKSSKPQSMTRIVTRDNRTSMPDIQLPEMSGPGDGLDDGLAVEFDMMPDLGDITIFGDPKSIGNDFEGTFYDFKRDRSGRGISMSDVQFVEEMTKFARAGWMTSKLGRFYRSPKKLYATTFTMPQIRSSFAPAAFDEADTIGYAWMVHYKGPLVHKEGIKFRFWGHGDDVLIVLVDKEVVLNAAWPDPNRGTDQIAGSWQSSSPKSRQYYLGNNTAVVGDWITLEPGVPMDMEVFMGEVPGGAFCSYLLVEVEGVKYERNKQNAPILPIFKTETPSHELIDIISEHLVVGEASITNGPIFRDYKSGPDSSASSARAEMQAPVELVEPDESPIRLWTRADGKTFEAEYLSLVSGNVVLKNGRGKQLKIPIGQFSPEDREYVELANPPSLNITFTKQTSQRTLKTTPYLNELPPRIQEYTFGVKLKQTSAGQYNHELTVEYFAIAKQAIDDQKYILIQRESSAFVPNKENNRSHQFKGSTLDLMTFNLDEILRGRSYAENLVIVTDKLGKIVDYSTSSKWLLKNVEKLKELPVGAFMDKTCTRVYASGPPTNRY